MEDGIEMDREHRHRCYGHNKEHSLLVEHHLGGWLKVLRDSALINNQ
jgi:hypothetical protein